MEKEELMITAKQALLELNDEEAEHLSEECATMLEYMKQMDEAEVEELEPTTYALSDGIRLREDIPEKNTELRDSLLKRAGEIEGTSFKIPKVLP